MKTHTGFLVAAVLTACGSTNGTGPDTAGPERITARPISTTTTVAAGTYGLLVATPKDAVLFIPTTLSAGSPVPLVVMLHGAGGTASTIDSVYAHGERLGFAVLAPKSRDATWDIAREPFTTDVPVINKALEETFKKVRVDPARIAIAGFSDGASYALTLGMANGDLFTHVIAFSPGFLRPVTRKGTPVFFISHGTADGILPFENTRQNIVPYLRTVGYNVRFDEFQGGHRMDPAEAEIAFKWLLGE